MLELRILLCCGRFYSVRHVVQISMFPQGLSNSFIWVCSACQLCREGSHLLCQRGDTAELAIEHMAAAVSARFSSTEYNEHEKVPDFQAECAFHDRCNIVASSDAAWYAKQPP